MLRVSLEKDSYSPGEVVQGTVILENEEELEEFTGFDLFLRAYEYSTFAFHLRVHPEELLLELVSSFKEPLIHGPILAPGVYDFPFSFSLPDIIPSSYEFVWDTGNTCQLRYYIEGNVYRRYGKREKILMAAVDRAPLASFTVPPSIILSKETIPLDHSEDDKSFLLSRTRGKLQTSFSTSQGYALPGQTIDVSIQIQNDSHKPVEAVSLRLETQWKFSASVEWQPWNIVLHETKKDLETPLDCGDSKILQMSFTVPDDTLPGFSRKIVQKMHAVVVQVHAISISGHDLIVTLSPFPIGVLQEEIPLNQ